MTAKVSKKNSFSTLSYQVLWLGSGIRPPRTIPLGPALADFVQSLNKDEDEEDDTTTVQEKCDSKPSNDSSPTTTHQDEEKTTEAQQMPLNEKKLRYLDTSTDKQYATEAEAQKDGVNPWFLYDWKVGRCITSYTSPSSHSNTSTLTTIHQ